MSSIIHGRTVRLNLSNKSAKPPRAGNNEIIATSGEGYKARADCEHGIELVKRDAPAAPVEVVETQSLKRTGPARRLTTDRPQRPAATGTGRPRTPSYTSTPAARARARRGRRKSGMSGSSSPTATGSTNARTVSDDFIGGQRQRLVGRKNLLQARDTPPRSPRGSREGRAAGREEVEDQEVDAPVQHLGCLGRANDRRA